MITILKDILNFLNSNSGALTVVFAFIVAIATIVYAKLTKSLVSETKKLRKAQTEPNVCAYVQIMPGMYPYSAFVIENIGMGPAHNVSFYFESDYTVFDKESVSEQDVFKQGINYLAPNQKVIPFLFAGETKKRTSQPPLNMTIDFKNSIGDDFKSSFTIVMDRNIGISEVEGRDTKKMEHEIRDLKNSVNALSNAIKKIK